MAGAWVEDHTLGEILWPPGREGIVASGHREYGSGNGRQMVLIWVEAAGAW